MSRTTLITIGVILVLLIGGGLFGFYFYLNQKAPSLASNNGKSQNFLSNIFSFGPNSNSSTSSSDVTTPIQPMIISNATTSIAGKVIVPALRQISVVPISGSTIIERKITSTSTATSTKTKKQIVVTNVNTKSFIRFMDRASGNIYETATDTLAISRITNTTFPKAYTSYFGADGNSLLIQNLLDDIGDSIHTYAATILTPKTSTSSKSSTSTTVIVVATTSPKTLQTTAISDQISFISLSPDKNQFLSLLSNTNGTQGVISKITRGTDSTILWNSTLHEWLSNWSSPSNITLTTKPSASVAGFSYLLNTKSKTFSKLLGGINGLTVSVSPDLTKVLVGSSDTDNASVGLALFQPKTHTTQQVFVKTLPEKCVWSLLNPDVTYCAVPDGIPSGTYPDDWYKGFVSFTDSIWKMNLKTGEARRVADLTNLSKKSIDVVNMSINEAEDYLLFTNKRDLTLWGLQLPKPVIPVVTATSTATSTKTR